MKSRFKALRKPIGMFSLLLIVFLVPHLASAQFAKGADIGWLSQMEATGYKFFDSTNTQKECLQILKDAGINTVRLRVWVNPSNNRINGHCSKKEVAAMALRAKNMGMRIMIDFHYSDSWADPAKQTKPAAWAGHTFTELLNDVYNHTFEVLDTLKSIGAKPDWAQIGNEIVGGMLWPDGSTSNWTQLAALLNKGYDAAKAVDNSIKVVLHIDQGNNNSRFRYFFDKATANNVRYDIIGASFYPYWLGVDYTAIVNDLGNNLNDMVSRYGKDVMVVEVGGDFTKVQNTYDMLVAVIHKVMAVPGNRGLGVIYWEPEGEKSWSGYQLNCWSNSGKPTRALYAFLTDNTLGMHQTEEYQDIRIYPNPANDGRMKVDFGKLSGANMITICDSGMKKISELNVMHQNPVLIDANLARGMYFLNINVSGQTVSRKFIVY